MNSRPDSSDAERPVSNREAAASETAQGSTPPKSTLHVRHYVVLRKELSGGALQAQNLHTSADSALKHVRAGGAYPADTRGVVLAATKEQLAKLSQSLASGGYVFHETVETDGPLAGSITGLGVIIESEQARVAIAEHLGHLKPWRAP